MFENIIPKVLVSKCLGFESVRYNGQIIPNNFIKQLKDYVEFIPVCPEVSIGLGVPRDPIRLVQKKGESQKLVQPSTQKDVTEDMNTYIEGVKNKYSKIDGMILKSQSPTCGINGVKLYSGMNEKQEFDKTRGMFGGAMIDSYKNCVIEDEGRLNNYNLRDAFLTKLFSFARFRHAKASGEFKNIIRFQSEYKYIFMTYDQELQKKMGQVLAKYNKGNFDEIVNEYEKLLQEMWTNHTDKKRITNALMHILGHFDELSSEEKEFFLSKLEAYKNDKLPLHGMLTILQVWAIRFDNDYIGSQALLEPYPLALMNLLDSGKGRV